MEHIFVLYVVLAVLWFASCGLCFVLGATSGMRRSINVLKKIMTDDEWKQLGRVLNRDKRPTQEESGI